MTKREAAIEEALREAVVRAGGLCIKLPASLYRGIPDRMILLPWGRIYFVELKREKGKPSIHQLRFRKILRSLGFPHDIIEGPDQLKEWLDDNLGGPYA